MNKTLVLLGPILLGFSATLVSGLLTDPSYAGYVGYGRPQSWFLLPRAICETCTAQFVWSGFILDLLFFTSISLLIAYASVLVYNVVRLVMGRGLTRKGLVLLRPLIVGLLVTLLTGLFRGLIFDREATLYSTPYGLPFSWYSVPTANCLQNSQLYDPRITCQAGFSGFFFLYDVLIFLELYLLLSYAFAVVYNAAPLFKNKKWPFFLPGLPPPDNKPTRS